MTLARDGQNTHFPLEKTVVSSEEQSTVKVMTNKHLGLMERKLTDWQEHCYRHHIPSLITLVISKPLFRLIWMVFGMWQPCFMKLFTDLWLHPCIFWNPFNVLLITRSTCCCIFLYQTPGRFGHSWSAWNWGPSIPTVNFVPLTKGVILGVKFSYTSPTIHRKGLQKYSNGHEFLLVLLFYMVGFI